MTLTEDDRIRLEAAGSADFFSRNDDDDLELRNLGGRCVFLSRGRCRVYDMRPEGCRLYPLVLDLADDQVVRDPFCPHRHEFSCDAKDERRLRESVAKERAEAMERRWKVGGSSDG
jgi:Fe-S-cluster containining protein